MSRQSYVVLQVQKVLRYLVVEDSLQQEHIALLWDLTEKVTPAAHQIYLCLLCMTQITKMVIKWSINPMLSHHGQTM